MDLHEIFIAKKYDYLLKKLKSDLSLITLDDVEFLEALVPAVKVYEYVIHSDDYLKNTACYTCKWKHCLTPSCYDGHIQGKKTCEWYQERT